MNETLEFVLLLTMGLLAILVVYMVKMNWDFMNHILPRLENVEVCFVGVRNDLELVKGFDALLEAAESVRPVARVSDSRDSSNVDDYYDDDDVLRKDDYDDVPKIIERLTEARKKKKKMRTY